MFRLLAALSITALPATAHELGSAGLLSADNKANLAPITLSAGTMEIGFVAIKPGRYDLRIPGSDDDTQRPESAIRR